ncbi:hypothetical protein RI129_012630 [Pyrocoelia pectoralis]|uniref:SCP domain-containing protein n=1 Tax=Pyrocoelia pectoralis TaxID=417401 RepID=A0AAN7UTT4_9COLE
MKLAWFLFFSCSMLAATIHCKCLIYGKYLPLSLPSKGKWAISDTGVKPNDQLLIVNEHNALRKSVADGKVPGQPKAINMKPLKWDSKLAQIAQSIANTCDYKHRKISDPRWWNVGQNIGKLESSTRLSQTYWSKFIMGWFNEHDNYHFTNHPIKGTGHYTQIVWADTEYVGCGYTNFRNSNSSIYVQFYVCNYGPGGNINGMTPYQIEPLRPVNTIFTLTI